MREHGRSVKLTKEVLTPCSSACDRSRRGLSFSSAAWIFFLALVVVYKIVERLTEVP